MKEHYIEMYRMKVLSRNEVDFLNIHACNVAMQLIQMIVYLS